MSVKTYPKGERFQLSEHFSLEDMDCHCDNMDCDTTTVDTDLIDALEKLWPYLGPFAITSGYRCSYHNQAVGGHPGSQHLLGRAADIRKVGMPALKMANAALSVQAFRNGGIGVPDEGDWIHVDTRGYPSRWRYPKAGGTKG